MQNSTAPQPPIDDGLDMDLVGAIEGADKSSSVEFAWDYLRHYEAVFRPFRQAAINLLEVGVQSGPSVRLWEWYFPAAQIVGIDIDPACAALGSERVRIEIGSQDDAEFLSRVCDAYPPSIFIDDGSHQAEHNIFTFEHVFPRLLPGGIYVVEDLKFHFGARAAAWQGKSARRSPEYFLDLARCCMAGQSVPGDGAIAAPLARMVDHVGFIGGAAIVTKRRAAAMAPTAAAAARRYIAARGRGPGAYLRLAEYLVRHHGDMAQAEAACAAAIEAGGANVAALTMQARVRQAMDRPAECARLLLQASEMASREPRELMALARALVGAKLTEQAAATVQRVLSIAPNYAPARHMRARLEARR